LGTWFSFSLEFLFAKVFGQSKSPSPLALAMGFSVPVLLKFQVSSTPAPVWAHVQQQQQHWQHIWREIVIDALVMVETLARAVNVTSGDCLFKL
jgi:hypothetical protein